MIQKPLALQSWHWEAVLLPMAPDEHRQAMTDVSELLRRLADKTSLEGLEVEFEPNKESIVHASLDGEDEFDLEIISGLAAYQHDTDDAAELVRHFSNVAEPVIQALAARAWFHKNAFKTVIGYRFVIAALLDPQRNLERMTSQLAGGVNSFGKRFFGSSPTAPLIGLELSAGYATTVCGEDVEVWAELACRADDTAIEGTVYVQTPKVQRLRPPWMSNLLQIHDEMWPKIENLSEALQAT
jgi:hypothetical protein